MMIPLLSWASDEEALFVRRIADFWQEGEYSIAKTQIEEFLQEFPESRYFHTLSSAMGDLCFREKNYSAALNHYAQVTDPGLTRQIFLNRMQCLYHMQWYATLADECEAYLQKPISIDAEEELQATYLLAIALYQQCLNAEKEPETLQKLALRARPYFETLFESKLSAEVAEGFAHLCCILKDHPKASQIYAALSERDPETEEEMLFNAALIQSEYDKELSAKSFGNIASRGEKRAPDAAYNQMVLLFDLGKYEELINSKELLLQSLAKEKAPPAHVYLGRSFLALKNYASAADAVQVYLEKAAPSDMARVALTTLAEAAFFMNDLPLLETAIENLAQTYPQSQELSKALFSKALALKKQQDLKGARRELEAVVARFPNFPQKAQALFELSHLDYQTSDWISCRKRAESFLTEFPTHELAPFARRYFLSASAEMASNAPQDKTFKEQLAKDIQSLLSAPASLSAAESKAWQFLLGKTFFELKNFNEAIPLLEPLCKEDPNANSLFLLALCYRDGLSDFDRFCKTAENALALNPPQAMQGQIHASLFNSYLERSQFEKAADHLYSAFETKAEIQLENLLWLSDFYGQLGTRRERTALLLGHILEEKKLSFEKEPQLLESVYYKLAQIHDLLDKRESSLSLLETLLAQYSAHPDISWDLSKETQLLLGQMYLHGGKQEEAERLFDAILASNSSPRASVAASASLLGARLKIAKAIEEKLPPTHPDLVKQIAQLKNLILQKTFYNEPIYLEAALDYVDLLGNLDRDSVEEKKLALLFKTKEDFERRDDLLSQDYHEAREKMPRIEKVYQGYMQFIDAEILCLQALSAKDASEQKQLQAKAKDLLLQIIEEKAHPDLKSRAEHKLNELIAVGNH